MLILLGFGGTNRAIAESFSPCIALDDSFTQKVKMLWAISCFQAKV